jgi:DDE superfamily endonuclease
MSVVYTAVLDVSEGSVLFLSGLLHAERYEGEPDTFTILFKKPKDGQLTVDEQTYNALHGALRCLGERANSLLKTTYKALRRGCP